MIPATSSPRSVSLGLILASVLGLSTVPSAATSGGADREPDRISDFASDAGDSVYFRQRTGEVMLFSTVMRARGSSVPTVIYVLDARSGRPIRKIPTGNSLAINFDPTGTRAAVSSKGREPLRIYDLTNGEIVHEIEEDEVTAWFGTWSPDGRRMAFTRKGGRTLALLDTRTRQQITLRENSWNALQAFAWAPDGKSLAIVEEHGLGLNSRRVILLDVNPDSPEPGNSRREFTIPLKCIGNVDTLLWSEPGLLIAAGAEHEVLDPEVIVGREAALDPESGEVLVYGCGQKAYENRGGGAEVRWTFMDPKSGRAGTYPELVGKPHPSREEPLPYAPDQPADRWSVEHEKLSDNLFLWKTNYGGFGTRVTDRDGNHLIQTSIQGHVDALGNTVRIFSGDGNLYEFDVRTSP